MARTKQAKRREGRPEVTIDWQQVTRLLQAGCSGNEIAAQLGIHPDTLYKHAVREHPDFETWTAFAQYHKASGDALLRAKQFKKAMDGNVRMLTFLGKQRLGQRDRVDVSSEQGFSLTIIDDLKRRANG